MPPKHSKPKVFGPKGSPANREKAVHPKMASKKKADEKKQKVLIGSITALYALLALGTVGIGVMSFLKK